MRAWRAWIVLMCWWRSADGEGNWRQQPFSQPAAFAVETTLLLADAAAQDRELGYRLTARLTVSPANLPHQDEDTLLHFRLQDTQVLTRGAHRNAEWSARGSLWDARADTAWHARGDSGRVAALYLDPAEPVDVLNYERALTSLFQFQVSDGEYNETDISGDCSVLYETVSDTVFRKIKRSCSHDDTAGVSVRRVSRYSVEGGRLLALHAEEVVALAGEPPLKARSWTALRRVDAGAAPPAARDLATALAALPTALAPAPLAMPPQPQPVHDEPEKLDAALREYRTALEGEAAGAGGGADAAAALLRLLPVLRSADGPRLTAALHDASLRDVLPGLCRALGLAGTAVAVRAAADFLQLAARDPLEPLAHAFLAGFALAPRAPDAAVLDVLKLAEEARHAAVAESALLAAGAAGSRAGSARAVVRDSLLRSLARCGDGECRAVRLRALGNLRVEAGDLLVTHAEGSDAHAAGAAIAALRRAPTMLPRLLMRLERLATNASAALEVRAAALELVVERRGCSGSGALPVSLAHVAAALTAERSRAAHELRRVLWGRVEALRSRCAELRSLLAALPLSLRSWEARAAGGTSHVLRRDTGWAGRGEALDSAQLAAGGLLRRGAVALLAREGEDLVEDLQVEVWTRGLEAIAGGGGDEGEGGDEAEGPAGGLALAVGGARLRGVQLFAGQAELLAHVWGGSGAEPTPVLRALRPLRDTTATLPLQCGCELRAHDSSAAALALDAHAAVSLWQRTARGALVLRAATAAQGWARVRTAWASLDVRSVARAEPRLRVAFDLDFYDGVALCVRASSPPHHAETSVEMQSEVGAPWSRVRRGRRRRAAGGARSLALGRPNDVVCRDLRANDDDDE